MTNGRGQLKRFFTSALAFAAVLALTPCTSLANPSGGQVTAGQAEISANGSTLTITQGSRTAVINWQSFSIGSGEVTNFLQPDSLSAVLNRVVSNDPSAIYGTLKANGTVLLVNQNGILVGPGAVIDTNSFLASTLDVSNDDFMAGKDLTFLGNSQAAIQNLGSITAHGGDVYLIAQKIENDGSISAAGTAGMLAGTEVYLKAAGSDRGSVLVGSAGPTQDGAAIENSGQVKAAMATMQATGSMYSVAVNNSGTVRATGATMSNGRVMLTAGGSDIQNSGTISAQNADGSGGEIDVNAGSNASKTATVYNSGTLDASGYAAGAKGGSVNVTGNRVALTDNAVVDVSGDAGGGTAKIGGGLHGQDSSISDASRTYVGPNAQIKADAVTSGNGGNVTVWSNNGTQFYGNINARGGAQSGNGGNVEVSGHDHLDFQGAVNTLAPNGQSGTLLLDPTNVTIDNGSDNNIFTTSSPFYPNGGTPSELTWATILGALSSGNVEVTTSSPPGADNSQAGNISITASPTGYNSSNNLTLTTASGGAISISAAVTNAGTGGLILNANGGLSITAALDFAAVTVNTGTQSIGVGGGAGTVQITSAELQDIGGSTHTAATLNLVTTAGSGTAITVDSVAGTDVPNIGTLALDASGGSNADIVFGTSAASTFGVTSPSVHTVNLSAVASRTVSVPYALTATGTISLTGEAPLNTQVAVTVGAAITTTGATAADTGDITLTGDNIDLSGGSIVTDNGTYTQVATLRPYTATTPIVIGSTNDGFNASNLGISAGTLDGNITATTIVVGRSSGSGNLTISAPVNITTNATDLQLITSGAISQSTSSDSITATGLVISNAGSVNLATAANVVTDLAANSLAGDFSFKNSGDLNISGNINGIGGISDSGYNVTLTVAGTTNGLTQDSGGAITTGTGNLSVTVTGGYAITLQSTSNNVGGLVDLITSGADISFTNNPTSGSFTLETINNGGANLFSLATGSNVTSVGEVTACTSPCSGAGITTGALTISANSTPATQFTLNQVLTGSTVVNTIEGAVTLTASNANSFVSLQNNYTGGTQLGNISIGGGSLPSGTYALTVENTDTGGSSSITQVTSPSVTTISVGGATKLVTDSTTLGDAYVTATGNVNFGPDTTTVAGNLTVDTSGQITQTGAIQVWGTFTTKNATSNLLNLSTNVFGNTVNLSDNSILIIKVGDVDLTSTISTTANLTVISLLSGDKWTGTPPTGGFGIDLSSPTPSAHTVIANSFGGGLVLQTGGSATVYSAGPPASGLETGVTAATNNIIQDANITVGGTATFSAPGVAGTGAGTGLSGGNIELNDPNTGGFTMALSGPVQLTGATATLNNSVATNLGTSTLGDDNLNITGGTTNGTLTVTSGGAITNSGVITVYNDNSSTTAASSSFTTTSGAITLDQANLIAGEISLDTSADGSAITLNNTNPTGTYGTYLGNVTTGGAGAFTVTSTYGIGQDPSTGLTVGTLNVTTTSTSAGNDVVLTSNLNSIASLGNVDTSAGGNNFQFYNANTFTVTGTVTAGSAGGYVDLGVYSGDITQTAGSITSNGLLLEQVGADTGTPYTSTVSLYEPANNVGTVAAQVVNASSTGPLLDVGYASNTSYSVGTVNSVPGISTDGGSVRLDAQGSANIDFAQGVDVTKTGGSTGNIIVSAASGSLTDSGGVLQLDTGNVYLLGSSIGASGNPILTQGTGTDTFLLSAKSTTGGLYVTNQTAGNMTIFTYTPTTPAVSVPPTALSQVAGISSAGVLDLENTATTGGAITINNSGLAVISAGGNTTISNAGQLSQTAAGTAVQLGTGTLTLAGGGQVGSGPSGGSCSGSACIITNAGTLDFSKSGGNTAVEDTAGTTNVSGTLGGGADLYLQGDGNINILAANLAATAAGSGFDIKAAGNLNSAGTASGYIDMYDPGTYVAGTSGSALALRAAAIGNNPGVDFQIRNVGNFAAAASGGVLNVDSGYVPATTGNTMYVTSVTGYSGAKVYGLTSTSNILLNQTSENAIDVVTHNPLNPSPYDVYTSGSSATITLKVAAAATSGPDELIVDSGATLFSGSGSGGVYNIYGGVSNSGTLDSGTIITLDGGRPDLTLSGNQSFNGSVTFSATQDIVVTGNISQTNTSGSLTFTADSDNNGTGGFILIDNSTPLTTDSCTPAPCTPVYVSTITPSAGTITSAGGSINIQGSQLVGIYTADNGTVYDPRFDATTTYTLETAVAQPLPPATPPAQPYPYGRGVVIANSTATNAITMGNGGTVTLASVDPTNSVENSIIIDGGILVGSGSTASLSLQSDWGIAMSKSMTVGSSGSASIQNDGPMIDSASTPANAILSVGGTVTFSGTGNLGTAATQTNALLGLTSQGYDAGNGVSIGYIHTAVGTLTFDSTKSGSNAYINEADGVTLVGDLSSLVLYAGGSISDTSSALTITTANLTATNNGSIILNTTAHNISDFSGITALTGNFFYTGGTNLELSGPIQATTSASAINGIVINVTGYTLTQDSTAPIEAGNISLTMDSGTLAAYISKTLSSFAQNTSVTIDTTGTPGLGALLTTSGATSLISTSTLNVYGDGSVGNDLSDGLYTDASNLYFSKNTGNLYVLEDNSLATNVSTSLNVAGTMGINTCSPACVGTLDVSAVGSAGTAHRANINVGSITSDNGSNIQLIAVNSDPATDAYISQASGGSISFNAEGNLLLVGNRGVGAQNNPIATFGPYSLEAENDGNAGGIWILNQAGDVTVSQVQAYTPSSKSSLQTFDGVLQASTATGTTTGTHNIRIENDGGNIIIDDRIQTSVNNQQVFLVANQTGEHILEGTTLVLGVNRGVINMSNYNTGSYAGVGGQLYLLAEAGIGAENNAVLTSGTYSLVAQSTDTSGGSPGGVYLTNVSNSVNPSGSITISSFGEAGFYAVFPTLYGVSTYSTSADANIRIRNEAKSASNIIVDNVVQASVGSGGNTVELIADNGAITEGSSGNGIIISDTRAGPSAGEILLAASQGIGTTSTPLKTEGNYNLAAENISLPYTSGAVSGDINILNSTTLGPVSNTGNITITTVVDVATGSGVNAPLASVLGVVNNANSTSATDPSSTGGITIENDAAAGSGTGDIIAYNAQVVTTGTAIGDSFIKLTAADDLLLGSSAQTSNISGGNGTVITTQNGGITLVANNENADSATGIFITASSTVDGSGTLIQAGTTVNSIDKVTMTADANSGTLTIQGGPGSASGSPTQVISYGDMSASANAVTVNGADTNSGGYVNVQSFETDSTAQSITALTGDFLLRGGDTSGSGSYAIIQSAGGQSVTVGNGLGAGGNFTVRGGNTGSGNYAKLLAAGAQSVHVEQGNLLVSGGTAGTGNYAAVIGDQVLNVDTGNFQVLGGDGSGAYALVENTPATNPQSITVSLGYLQVEGADVTGGGSYARIYSTTGQSIMVGNGSGATGGVTVAGGDGTGSGNYAQIQADGDQSITVATGDLLVSGGDGSGSNSYGEIIKTTSTGTTGQTIDVQTGSITVRAGTTGTTGTGNYGRIYSALAQSITSSLNFTLTGGPTTGSYALIQAAGDQQLTVGEYLDIEGGTQPSAATDNYAVIYGQSTQEITVNNADSTAGTGGILIKGNQGNSIAPSFGIASYTPGAGIVAGDTQTVTVVDGGLTVNGGSTDGANAGVYMTNNSATVYQYIYIQGADGSGNAINITGGTQTSTSTSPNSAAYGAIDSSGAQVIAKDNTNAPAVGNILVNGGSGASAINNQAFINSALGPQLITNAGNITLTAGATGQNNAAWIGSGGSSQSITTTGDLTVQAGGTTPAVDQNDLAGIFATGTAEPQTITVAGLVKLDGGNTTDNLSGPLYTSTLGTLLTGFVPQVSAVIDATGQQTLYVGYVNSTTPSASPTSLTLNGGTGGYDGAYIQTLSTGAVLPSYDQLIKVNGTTALNGGLGSGAVAEIKSAGSQSLTTTDYLALIAGGGANANVGITTVDTQNIYVGGNTLYTVAPFTVDGGAALAMYGGNNASGGDAFITQTGTGTTTQTIEVGTGDLQMYGGTGNGGNAYIDASGLDNSFNSGTGDGAAQLIKVDTGNLRLDSGTGYSYAKIDQSATGAASQYIDVPNGTVSLLGDTSAASSTEGWARIWNWGAVAQTLNIGTGLTITGGSNTGASAAYAGIHSQNAATQTVTVYAGDATLTGGTGNSADAFIIQDSSGTQTVDIQGSGGGNLILQSGLGAGTSSNAYIANNSGTEQDIYVRNGYLTVTGGASGSGSSANSAFIISHAIQNIGTSLHPIWDYVALFGGSGQQADAYIQAGTTQNIYIQGTTTYTNGTPPPAISGAALALYGGSNTTNGADAYILQNGSGATPQTIDIASGNLQMYGGLGKDANVYIEAKATDNSFNSGNGDGAAQLIHIHIGDLVMNGGTSSSSSATAATFPSSAWILQNNTGGSQFIQVDGTSAPNGTVTLQGGAGANEGAIIESHSEITQILNIAQGMTISGGVGSLSGAGIVADMPNVDQNITVSNGSVSLTGGSGSQARAFIDQRDQAGTQEITLSLGGTGDLSLMGGTGATADARIKASGTKQKITVSNGALTVQANQSTSPSIVNNAGNAFILADNTTAALQDIEVTGGGVTVQGGVGTSEVAYIQLGPSPTSTTFTTGQQIINVTGPGNLEVLGGSGASSYAEITSSGVNGTLSGTGEEAQHIYVNNGNLVVDANYGANSAYASIAATNTGAASQYVYVKGSITVTAGAGSSEYAQIQANGTGDHPATPINALGQEIYADTTMTVTAGSGSTAYALVSSKSTSSSYGDQQIVVNNSGAVTVGLSIQGAATGGSTGNEAGIVSASKDTTGKAQSITVNDGDVLVSANNSVSTTSYGVAPGPVGTVGAVIQSAGTQYIDIKGATTGNFSITGGDVSGSRALVSMTSGSGVQTILVENNGNLTLQGGGTTGTNAQAVIESNNTQNIGTNPAAPTNGTAIYGYVTLNGGDGANADAIITAVADQNIYIAGNNQLSFGVSNGVFTGPLTNVTLGLLGGTDTSTGAGAKAFISQTGTGSQTIVTQAGNATQVGNTVVEGGSGDTAEAYIESKGAEQTLTLYNGQLNVLGGTYNAADAYILGDNSSNIFQTLDVYDGGVVVAGGSASGTSAQIEMTDPSGQQQINLISNGDLVVEGGDGASAFALVTSKGLDKVGVVEAQHIAIDAGQLEVLGNPNTTNGGGSATISQTNSGQASQHITVDGTVAPDGTITVQGGVGTGDQALITSNGTGVTAPAPIAQYIYSTQGMTITGGTGSNSYALVSTTNAGGNQNITVVSGGLTVQGQSTTTNTGNEAGIVSASTLTGSAGPAQAITVEDGNVVVAANDSLSSSSVTANYGLAPAPNGTVGAVIQSAGTQYIDIQGATSGNFSITGGDVNGSRALVAMTNGSGDQTILVENNGNLTLNGGAGSSAQAAIESANTQTVGSSGTPIYGYVTLRGGDGQAADAIITAVNNQNIYIAANATDTTSPFTNAALGLYGGFDTTDGGDAIISQTGTLSGETQTIVVDSTSSPNSGSLDIIGGYGTNADAGISAAGAGGQNIDVNNGALLVQGNQDATYGNSDAYILQSNLASGAQNIIVVNGGITVQGGAGSSETAYIQQNAVNANQYILAETAGNLNVIGGDGANSTATITSDGGLTSYPAQHIKVDSGNLLVQGNQNTTNGGGSATISQTNLGATQQWISVNGTITVEGGLGAGDYALITTDASGFVSTSLAQYIHSADSFTVTGGVGAGSYALVSTTNATGNQSIGVDSGGLTVQGTTTGGYSANEAGIVSAALGANAQSITVTDGNLTLAANSSVSTTTYGILSETVGAVIQSSGQQYIEVVGNTAPADFTITGGNVSGSRALVSMMSTAQDQTVLVDNGNLAIDAGTGTSASAMIRSNNIQTVTASLGQISLTGATGTSLTTNGGVAQIWSASDQSVTAHTGLTLNGGNSSGYNDYALIYSGGVQGITVDTGNLNLNGNQGNSLAPIGTYKLGAGIVSDTTGTQTVTVSNGNLVLTGGSAADAAAVIDQAGAFAQTLNVSTNITVTGGSANNAFGVINSAGTQTIQGASGSGATGGNLVLTGGTAGNVVYAAVQSTGTQSITIGTGIKVLGGSSAGTDDYALILSNAQQTIETLTGGLTLSGNKGQTSGPIDSYNFGAGILADTAGTQTITVDAGGLSMTGGSATNAGALIDQAFAAQQSIDVTGTTSLTGGSGAGAFALIVGSSTQTIHSTQAMSLTGGTANSGDYAAIVGSNQTAITVDAGGLTLNGNQGTTAAPIDGYNFGAGIVEDTAGTQTLTVNGGLTLLGGSGTNSGALIYQAVAAQQTVAVTGTTTLTGGSGTGSFALIQGTGAQTLTSSQAMTLTGGSANNDDFAAVVGDSTQAITVASGDLTLDGGQGTTNTITFGEYNFGAGIVSDTAGTQTIAVNSGNLVLTGGSAADAAAVIDQAVAAQQTITVSGTTTLTGGSAAGAFALIDGSGNQTITSGGVLKATGGSAGSDDFAGILGNAVQNLTVTSGNLVLTAAGGAENTLTIGAENAGAFVVGDGNQTINVNSGSLFMYGGSAASALIDMTGAAGGTTQTVTISGDANLNDGVGGNARINTAGDQVITTSGTTNMTGDNGNQSLISSVNTTTLNNAGGTWTGAANITAGTSVTINNSGAITIDESVGQTGGVTTPLLVFSGGQGTVGATATGPGGANTRLNTNVNTIRFDGVGSKTVNISEADGVAIQGTVGTLNLITDSAGDIVNGGAPLTATYVTLQTKSGNIDLSTQTNAVQYFRGIVANGGSFSYLGGQDITVKARAKSAEIPAGADIYASNTITINVGGNTIYLAGGTKIAGTAPGPGDGTILSGSDQTYDSRVFLSTDYVIHSTGAGTPASDKVTFTRTLDGPGGLEIGSTPYFNGYIGSVTPLAYLYLNSKQSYFNVPDASKTGAYTAVMNGSFVNNGTMNLSGPKGNYTFISDNGYVGSGNSLFTGGIMNLGKNTITIFASSQTQTTGSAIPTLTNYNAWNGAPFTLLVPYVTNAIFYKAPPPQESIKEKKNLRKNQGVKYLVDYQGSNMNIASTGMITASSTNVEGGLTSSSYTAVGQTSGRLYFFGLETQAPVVGLDPGQLVNENTPERNWLPAALLKGHK